MTSKEIEQKIARILTEYAALKDAPEDFLESSVDAILALIQQATHEARADELMHISTDTNDELCICYFDEDGDCDRDVTIEDRISELKGETK
jgi:hypothetical protein